MGEPLTKEEMVGLIRSAAEGKGALYKARFEHAHMVQTLAQHALSHIDDVDCPLSPGTIQAVTTVIFWWVDYRDGSCSSAHREMDAVYGLMEKRTEDLDFKCRRSEGDAKVQYERMKQDALNKMADLAMALAQARGGRFDGEKN